VLLQHLEPAGTVAERSSLEKELKEYLLRYLKKYSENPRPFTWTKGPEQLQRIIEATKEYQAAHPKQPKQRKRKKAAAK
jgi:hypothetical protein